MSARTWWICRPYITHADKVITGQTSCSQRCRAAADLTHPPNSGQRPASLSATSAAVRFSLVELVGITSTSIPSDLYVVGGGSVAAPTVV